jgi:IS5 family transposase
LGIGDKPPSKSALNSNIKAIGAETLQEINRILVQHAADSGIEKGRRVRIDATAIESNIHHPTDSELLWDCIRVVVRLMRGARRILGADVVRFAERTRRAKRRRKEINTQKGRRQRQRAYRDLLKVAAETHRYGLEARQVLQASHALGIVEGAVLTGIADELDHYLPLMQRVMEQTRRRVVEGEKVPAEDKIVSIFEEHTDIIIKSGADPIYGHKLCLTAGASSMVLDCKVLEGNPADSTLAVEMVDRQIDIYDRAPQQATYDGAFASKDNLVAIKGKQVQDVVFAKSRGIEISDMAKSTWVYKRLRKFRAGVEGIISFLKRVFGLSRCTWRSLPSFESYVWSSVLACNLMVMARHLTA